MKNLQLNIIRKTECFLPMIGNKEGCLLSPSLFDVVWEILTSAIKKENELKVNRFKRDKDYIYLQTT